MFLISKIKAYFSKLAIHKVLKPHPKGRQLERIAQFLIILYSSVDSAAISKNERQQLMIEEDDFIYGEIEFLSFMFLLDKAQPKAHEKFYDLGAGTGKAVLTAALCYDFRAVCGIELLPSLFEQSNYQLTKARQLINFKDSQLNELYLQRLANVFFKNANFFSDDISDGDVIFINATCLSYAVWNAIIEKLKTIKVGSRVIITTKKIENESFSMVYQGTELMSWGVSSVHIYMKIS